MAAESEALRAFMERHKHMATRESHEKALNFKPRPDDVFLVTPTKSGTTWMQQICHGLRSGGSMDFGEVSLVFPFLEGGHDYGYTDLQKEQVAHPRMFKTHYRYSQCPKGAGKYIYVTRDPKDAGVSLYHFLGGWVFDTDSISIEEFILNVFVQRAKVGPVHASSNWQSIASWYPHRNDPNVLWLHFEDLKQDLKTCIKLIAEFLDTGAEDEELHELVTKQASMDFMKQHHTKFDDHPLKLARNPALGLPIKAGLQGGHAKVRSGKMGEAKKVLPQHVIDALDDMWDREVEPSTGYSTYEELRSGINKELGRPFGWHSEI